MPLFLILKNKVYSVVVVFNEFKSTICAVSWGSKLLGSPLPVHTYVQSQFPPLSKSIYFLNTYILHNYEDITTGTQMSTYALLLIPQHGACLGLQHFLSAVKKSHIKFRGGDCSAPVPEYYGARMLGFMTYVSQWTIRPKASLWKLLSAHTHVCISWLSKMVDKKLVSHVHCQNIEHLNEQCQVFYTTYPHNVMQAYEQSTADFSHIQKLFPTLHPHTPTPPSHPHTPTPSHSHPLTLSPVCKNRSRCLCSSPWLVWLLWQKCCRNSWAKCMISLIR